MAHITKVPTLCSARWDHEVAGGCSGGDQVAGKAKTTFSLQTSLGRSKQCESARAEAGQHFTHQEIGFELSPIRNVHGALGV
jgi:hypothetical protein